MEQKERLIEIIQKSVGGCARNWAEVIADGLLADGWMRPPCKVGDTVYYLGGLYNRLIKSATVEEIILNSNGARDLLVTSENNVTFENSIDIFYFTREEAERELERRKQ